MTHEEFLGVRSGTVHLTDEDRKRIENTLLWQQAKLSEAMHDLGGALAATWLGRHARRAMLVLMTLCGWRVRP
mgnify:CR=1 FL=1